MSDKNQQTGDGSTQTVTWTPVNV